MFLWWMRAVICFHFLRLFEEKCWVCPSLEYDLLHDKKHWADDAQHWLHPRLFMITQPRQDSPGQAAARHQKVKVNVEDDSEAADTKHRRWENYGFCYLIPNNFSLNIFIAHQAKYFLSAVGVNNNSETTATTTVW